MRVIVAAHWRLNPKTGKREWVDTYTRHVQGGSGVTKAKSGKLVDLMDAAHVDKTPGSFSRLQAHVAVQSKKDRSTKTPSSKVSAEAARLHAREALLPGGHPPTAKTPGWAVTQNDARHRLDARGETRDSATRLTMTDAEWEKYSSAAEDKISALSSSETTAQKYGTGPGAYTPERTAQQKQVLDSIMASAANVPQEKKAVFTGGLPGAGKSSSLRAQNIAAGRYFTLDPDKVKEEMLKHGMAPEVDGVTPLETAALIHEESSNIMDAALEQLSSQGTNLLVDGTMTWQPYVERQTETLGKNGYTIKGLFVSTDADQAERRTMARYREGVEDFIATGKGWGGRLVQKSVSKHSRKLDPFNTFNAIRDVFHSWVVYDNSGEGTRLIDSSHETVQFAAHATKQPPQAVSTATAAFLQGKLSADAVVKLVDWGVKLPAIPTGQTLMTQDYYRYVEVAEPNSILDVTKFFIRMTPAQRSEIEEAIARSGH